MKEWDSDEMRRLQDEAKKRVLEMKERSRFAAEEMNGSVNRKNNSENDRKEPVRAIKMPVELPDNYSDKGAVRTNKQGFPFLDCSDDDLERLFLMSLCLLLSYEHSDDELMVAMMYMMT